MLSRLNQSVTHVVRKTWQKYDKSTWAAEPSKLPGGGDVIFSSYSERQGVSL